MITLESFDAFVTRLKNFDWYYQMSDDHRTWLAGEAATVELKKIEATSVYYQEAFYIWKDYVIRLRSDPDAKTKRDNRLDRIRTSIKEGLIA